MIRSLLICGLLASLYFLTPTASRADDGFTFQKGDRVALIGNALAERMQHDGWLETLIQSRLPEHQLRFRNLGFSGDELVERSRSAGFGSPDEWLTRVQADVIFAFFGYNESFADETGLASFQKQLADFITRTKGQKYNGNSAPRLVLFSPIGFENLHTPNFPDGSEHNRRLKLYTKAMAQIAKEHQVPFVDLIRPTLTAYEQSNAPLTINGLHLNERGNQTVAEVIVQALFPGKTAPETSTEQVAKLRDAIKDKNFYWFHRYRTTDGYNVYGGRSNLRFTDNISNRDVMQREMEILDAMTTLRDERVWAIANGRDREVDDTKTPDFIPVKTNKPGPLPNGLHQFLGGEEAISKMTVHEGMKVELFASEEQFPELINPVQMAFDTKGRLWVATWPSYPHWKPKDEMDDRLLILEDTNGDGKADVCKTFAGGLHNPTGFEFWNGGVIVSMAPDLIFLKDTTGDDKADVRERLLHGIDSADTHHTANSFILGPGGGLYFQEGTFHQSQIETLHQGSQRNNNGCVWRFDPRTHRVDRYVPHNFANPHGHVFDRWGQDFIHDGTGAVPYHGVLFSGFIKHPAKHPTPPVLYNRRTRPCPATEILSSRHFPDEMQGDLLVENVIGFLGILRYKFRDDGSSFQADEVEPILSSTDPNFRPVDLEMAPDGSLYFVDWQNPIIGHMQHHIRDPSRDTQHGRVYRITYPSRPLVKAPKIDGESIPTLLELLREPEDRTRYRVRIELSGRDSDAVLAAVKEWVANLEQDDPNHDHLMLQALWLHQHHNVPNRELLDRVLNSSDYRARAAAVRVLGYWADAIPDALARLKKAAADEHPRVRLEAVRAASFFSVAEAIEVPLIATDLPTDRYLDYVRDETMKALEPYWRQALADGRDINVTSDAGMRYLLRGVSNDELLKMKRNRGVFVEMLYRPGLRDEHRREALTGLAKAEGKSELAVLLDAIQNLDAKQPEPSLVFDLVRLLTARGTSELSGVRGQLEAMATNSSLPVVRRIGYVALVSADGTTEPAWKLGSADVSRLRDLVSAVPLIPDPSVRDALYGKVEPLLHGLPDHLATGKPTSKGTFGRYIRVELPGPRRTLTLAEVEVFADGRNVARSGKASQNATAHGGVASRAIDGNTNGTYGAGGQTHTPENRPNPWWEVDLGAEYPIESIRVHNRTEANFHTRLDGYTLLVLDAKRHPVFERKGIKAQRAPQTTEVGGGGPEGVIRREAMRAITQFRGKEADSFRTLATFVTNGIDRVSAVRAIQRIPRQYWPADEAEPLLDSLLDHLAKIPEDQRTSASALEALQLGDTLASLLPAEQARQARQKLGELGVRVLRIGTLPHRMAYDQERLAIQAGKRVEVIFENTDIMPHNFVLVRPGALEEVGMLAEETAQGPDAIARQYVPKSNKVILAGKLLQPQEVETLGFTAPTEPGVYPYVCTYPGHWRRMYGALYVVADLDAYLADAEAYLAENPLPIKDDLLKFNRPRREWTFEELAPLVQPLEEGRSFGNGRQIFRVASCVGCHKLNGEGQEFGPNLAELDPKFTHAQILREIVEPSHEINEKYQSYTFFLVNGQVVTGLVVKESPKAIHVVENPLAKTEPVVIAVADIDEKVKAKESLMPKGLLDKLTREEILDLLAYVIARGKEDHSLYKGGHHHNH